MTPHEYTEALISAAQMPDRDATFTRLIAACYDVANSGGKMRANAITRVRDLARQLDQEETCPSPSTSSSSTTSETSSQTTQNASGSASRTPTSRTRTMTTTTRSGHQRKERP